MSMSVVKFKTRASRLDEEKRKLIDVAMKYGLRDQRTINQSWVVDELIVEEQRRRLDCYKKNRLASACRLDCAGK